MKPGDGALGAASAEVEGDLPFVVVSLAAVLDEACCAEAAFEGRVQAAGLDRRQLLWIADEDELRAELDEKNQLLRKARGAIERLQDELEGASRSRVRRGEGLGHLHERPPGSSRSGPGPSVPGWVAFQTIVGVGAHICPLVRSSCSWRRPCTTS